MGGAWQAMAHGVTKSQTGLRLTLLLSSSCMRDSCSIPGSGRSLGGGNGNLLQFSCLGNSTARGAWWAAVQEVTESNRTATLKTQEDIPATGLTTNTCVHSRTILLLIFIRSFNKQALSAVCLRGQTQAPSPPAQKQKLSFKRAQAVSSANLCSKYCGTDLEESVLPNRTS